MTTSQAPAIHPPFPKALEYEHARLYINGCGAGLVEKCGGGGGGGGGVGGGGWGGVGGGGGGGAAKDVLRQTPCCCKVTPWALAFRLWRQTLAAQKSTLS